MSESAYGHMVQEYYVQRYRALAAARDAKLAAIKSRADALHLCSDTRRRIRRVFGPFPKRTALNPRITGRVTRARYVLENVLFESRPGYFISANLYVPKGTGPHPAVLATCGHADNGKAMGNYQRFARGLAEHGHVVLLFDPVSQGERHQFVGLPAPQRPRGCVREHLVLGRVLAPLGEFFGSWHLWDGIRALDYLLSRFEVDRTRVGVTGNSGGGTQTTYLNAMDDRFTMAAPSCFVTTYLSNLENELPCDNEQIPPGIVGAGLDMGDFFIAQAPRPTLLIGQHDDFFDERGLRKVFEQVRSIYALLGARDRVRLHIGPGGHGYQVDGRRAMYRFFNHLAGLGESDRESTRPVEQDRTLQAAPRGRVANVPGHRFLHDCARDRAETLTRRRKRLNPPTLRAALRQVLELPRRPRRPCHYRVLRAIEPPRPCGYDIGWVFAVETEPGIQCTLHQWERRGSKPRSFRAQLDPPARLTLYVPHQSSEQDLAARHPPRTARMLWSIDPRGMGDSTPRTCGREREPLNHIGPDYFYWAQGLMLGESYLGRRVHDVLATLDLLGSRGARGVHLIGRGMGSIITTFAACLHPLVHRVTLRHGLRSFHELAQTPVPQWPISCIPWGVLKRFDLPDCHSLLGPRLRFQQPWDARMRPA